MGQIYAGITIFVLLVWIISDTILNLIRKDQIEQIFLSGGVLEEKHEHIGYFFHGLTLNNFRCNVRDTLKDITKDMKR